MHNRSLFQSFRILLIAQCIRIQTMFFALVTCLAAISSSRPSPITTYVTFFPNLDTILSKQLSLPDKKKTFPLKTLLLSSISKERDAARFTCLCLDKVRAAAGEPAGPLPKECETVPFTPQTFQALAPKKTVRVSKELGSLGSFFSSEGEVPKILAWGFL